MTRIGSASPSFLNQMTRALSGFALVGLLFWAQPYSVGYNATHSLPTGLYLTKALSPGEAKVGDIVCFEYLAPDWAAPRNYFMKGSRLCKFLTALPGTRIERDDVGLWVGARSGPPLAEFAAHDSKGRALPNNALTTGLVEPGYAVVLTPLHKTSMDSRLLGPIPLANITHKAWPLWTQD